MSSLTDGMKFWLRKINKARDPQWNIVSMDNTDVLCTQNVIEVIDLTLSGLTKKTKLRDRKYNAMLFPWKKNNPTRKSSKPNKTQCCPRGITLQHLFIIHWILTLYLLCAIHSRAMSSLAIRNKIRCKNLDIKILLKQYLAQLFLSIPDESVLRNMVTHSKSCRFWVLYLQSNRQISTYVSKITYCQLTVFFHYL